MRASQVSGKCQGSTNGELLLTSASKLDDASPVALGGAPFRERRVLLHRFALGGFSLATLLALVRFAVERVGCGGRAANFAEGQDLDVKFAAFVLYEQHVTYANIARGLCLRLRWSEYGPGHKLSRLEHGS